jgi:glutathione synthase/RimK-type ligase-like ATP-grasp enzyme
VTVVGEEVFPAAIYTSLRAKDDWRRHQLGTNEVEFKREKLDCDTERQCLRYLKSLGLGFGAFDLVESADGAITFLECNTNGQFGWLEDELDLPISAAIARWLHGRAD